MVNKVTLPENFSEINKFTYKQLKAEEIYGDEQRNIEAL